ncbi:alpha-galactosidase [Frigoribacterium salinisoli]
MTTTTSAPTTPAIDPVTAVHLTAGGVSLLLDLTDGRLPSVVHWGAALGAVTGQEARALTDAAVPPVVANEVDVPVRLALLPEHHTGWVGRPGLSGSRQGRDWSPLFTVVDVALDAVDGSARDGGLATVGAGTLTVDARDEVAALSLRIEVELGGSGLLRLRATVTNDADEPYDLGELSLALPVPARAHEILDLAGRWGLERTPQRRPLVVGQHLREGRKGRTGSDAATVLSVGVPGFGFARGEVWGLHVGFSGDHRSWAERTSAGLQVVGGGELLLPGEVRLARDEAYQGPWLYASYGDGLDEQAQRFHRWLRARPQHPRSPRPVTINVWEAVYFDHDLDRLKDLADRAAALGVERYVLDDGWFQGRRDDTAGLGDWVVDADVWPDGLGPIVDHVTGLGMEFGLWFEPEMVNEDSDLARAHPEWILQTGGRLPVRSRNQQVLDLGRPEAYEHVLGQMTAVLEAYDIAYVKWDHNRDLVDAGTVGGVPGVHRQTLATYRLMDELKRRFPGLEIESCSSGGARVDLGVLERTDRVWVSDCIDPLDRQQMMRWTEQLLPPELLGAHVASGRNHTTGRMHDLAFRAGTAVFGHLGIEWDLRLATDDESDQLRQWIELHRRHRELLHSGDVVRVDEHDPSMLVHGVVAEDRSEALFALATVGRSEIAPLGRFTLRGLDPERRYVVEPVAIGGVADEGRPHWYGGTFSGRALMVAGLQTPATRPEQVVLLEVRGA